MVVVCREDKCGYTQDSEPDVCNGQVHWRSNKLVRLDIQDGALMMLVLVYRLQGL